MNFVYKYFLLINFLSIGQAALFSQANQDYFKIHAGALPVTIYVGNAGKPGSLLGVDGQKGIIYAQMQGAGRMQLELRGLDKQNIKGFAMAWPADAMKTLKSFSNEQYNASYFHLCVRSFTRRCSALKFPSNTLPFMIIAWSMSRH